METDSPVLGISRDEMLETIRRIVRVVEAPVTADLEGAYEPALADAAATARAAIAVGLNVEHTQPRRTSNASPNSA